MKRHGLHKQLTALLVILFSAAPAAAAEGDWWNDAWRCRRDVFVPASPASAATVAFPTGGFMRNDAADIRVVVDGEVRPHVLVFKGPGDMCRIAFATTPGARRYHVYYGNPQAAAPARKWKLRAGLLLQTSSYNDTPFQFATQLPRIAQESRPVHGADFVDRVFHGFNLFGPSGKYVAAYRGWLRCSRRGKYTFATTSGGPSVLMIDGKQICSRTRLGNPPGRAYHRGTVELKAGQHRFEYYTIQRYGRHAAVAAWQTPGQSRRKFDVIPARAFTPVTRATLADYRLRDDPVAPDFTWRNLGEAEIGEHVFVRMRFSDATRPRGPVRTLRWSFGDGVTSTGRLSEHIFLAAGTYRVSLTVTENGTDYTAAHRVYVARAWDKQATRKPEPLQRYARAAQTWAAEKLTLPALSGAVRLFHEVGAWQHQARAGRSLLSRKSYKYIGERALSDMIKIVGADFRGPVNDQDGAIALFRLGESKCSSKALKSKMALETGDTHFYHLNNVERARAEYLRLLRQYEGADAYATRQAYIRIGDTFVATGGYDEAMRNYGKAESLPIGYTAPRKQVAIGSRALETEDFLKRKQTDAAAAALNAWQWENPTEKLRGQWSVQMARCALARKNVHGAIKELMLLMGVNPESEFAPKALMLLADCYQQQGKIGDAIRALEKLKHEYPESPEHDRASSRIESLARKKK